MKPVNGQAIRPGDLLRCGALVISTHNTGRDFPWIDVLFNNQLRKLHVDERAKNAHPSGVAVSRGLPLRMYVTPWMAEVCSPAAEVPGTEVVP